MLTDEIVGMVAGLIIGPYKELASHWISKWRGISADNLKFNFQAVAERDDITHRLSEVKIPALMMWGNEDSVVSHSNA